MGGRPSCIAVHFKLCSLNLPVDDLVQFIFHNFNQKSPITTHVQRHEYRCRPPAPPPLHGMDNLVGPANNSKRVAAMQKYPLANFQTRCKSGVGIFTCFVKLIINVRPPVSSAHNFCFRNAKSVPMIGPGQLATKQTNTPLVIIAT